MVRTRLVIGTNNIDAPIVEDLPLSMNFQQSDIRNPDKVNSSYTKTVRLYESNAINTLFENIFEVNLATMTFNPNKKEPAKYYANEEEQFNGYLQLLRITKTPQGVVMYECSLIGEAGNLFTDIGDSLMTDLDFSELDHSYTRANIINSWNTSIIRNGSSDPYAPGNGYYYPLVNRGSIAGDESIWRVADFIPCIYDREYIKKIIEGRGYTIVSNFLDTTYFKRQITYPNIDQIVLSQTQLNNRQFYVGRSSNIVLYDLDSQGANVAYGPTSFNKESTPFFDVGSNYTAPNYTVPANGQYNFVAKLRYKVTITHTNPLAVYSDSIVMGNNNTFSMQIRRQVGGSVSVLAAIGTTPYGVFNEASGQPLGNSDFKSNFETSTPFYFNMQVGTGDVVVNSGDLIQLYKSIIFNFRRDISNNPVRFYDASMTLITTGSMHVKVEIDSTDERTSLYGLVPSKQILEGDMLEMNQALPINIKQKDYLKSIMQKYFLQIQPDRTNPKVLVIEPYNDYYDGDVVDWENKVDKDKDFVVSPMSELDAKSYTFKYKSDKDYYNTLYENSYREPFGTHKEEIDNDFIKTDKGNELIFSPTPNVANYTLGIAYPKIYTVDNNQIKRITPNIRSLWAEMKSCNSAITFKETGGADLIINYYGYAGHTDDPFNPTYDLNFGLPKEVYYSFLQAQFTTNDLYNMFYRSFVEAIAHRDSKLVTGYLWLTPTDIRTFSFRNKYFVDGTYYQVNSILDYDPDKETSTKVEMFKLADVQVFTPESIGILSLNSMSTERKAPTVPGTYGKNINVYTEYPVLVMGEDITIGQNARNISVVGSSGINVAPGVENVTVMNSTGLEITQSNVSYNNNVLTAPWNNLYGAFLRVNSVSMGAVVVMLNETHGTIVGNCALNDVECYLPDPATVCLTDSEGMQVSKIYHFSKSDSSSNKVRIFTSTGLINGAAYYDITTQYDCAAFQTDGFNWFQISK